MRISTHELRLIGAALYLCEGTKERLLKKKMSVFKANPLGTIKIRYSHKEHFLKIKGIINEVFGSGGVA